MLARGGDAVVEVDLAELTCGTIANRMPQQVRWGDLIDSMETTAYEPLVQKLIASL